MIRKVLSFIGILITISVALLYLIASLSAYLSTSRFPFLTFTSLIYLPILITYGILILVWFQVSKRISILLLLLLFTGYQNLFSTVGVNFFHSWKWKKEKSTIRILSWNVNGFDEVYKKNDTIGSVRQQMLKFIQDVQPDILCVQDFRESEVVGTNNDFVNNIADVFTAGKFSSVYYPYYYLYDGANYCDKIGVAIFSRFPFADSGSVKLNEEKAGYIDVIINKKMLRIYNAHLSSMSLWPSAKDQAGIYYLEGDSTKIKARGIFSKIKLFGQQHSRESEVVKNFINKSPYPVVFTADLNSVPSSYVYHHLRDGLEDAFLEKSYGVGGTYNRIFPKLRIDVLFHSKEIEVTQFKRPAIDLSDHYPIIADIKWNK